MKKLISILACSALLFFTVACSSSASPNSISLPNETISTNSTNSSSIGTSDTQINSYQFFTDKDSTVFFSLSVGDTFGGMTLADIKYSGDTFEDFEKYIVSSSFEGEKTITGVYYVDFFDDIFVPDDKYIADFAYLKEFADFPHQLLVSFPNNNYDPIDYVTSPNIKLKIEQEQQKIIDSEVEGYRSYSSEGIQCTITINQFSSFYGSDTTGECFVQITNITE